MLSRFELILTYNLFWCLFGMRKYNVKRGVINNIQNI